jgi:hypothetical protein
MAVDSALRARAQPVRGKGGFPPRQSYQSTSDADDLFGLEEADTGLTEVPDQAHDAHNGLRVRPRG